jgi:formyltetrahydrofolate hydrolase
MSDMQALASEMKMDYEIRSVVQKPKVMIMVSKTGHCLNDRSRGCGG